MRFHLLAFVIVVWGLSGPVMAEDPQQPSVVIRIHDYAHISDNSMARAQQVVTDTYHGIGVRIDWRETIRPNEGPLGPEATEAAPRQLLIIILPEQMTRTRSLARNVVGIAPVNLHHRSHIAYVFFNRVSDVADAVQTDPMYVTGVVIAHEIGHLLLPNGSHSVAGLMQRRLGLSDLRDNRLAGLTFTDVQADLIRKTVTGSPQGAMNEVRNRR